MNPKEKAKELIDKFEYEIITPDHYEGKGCALLCVNEIIEATKSIPDASLVIDNEWTTIGEYWQQVKEEITKA
jgi:hypothetical protein